MWAAIIPALASLVGTAISAASQPDAPEIPEPEDPKPQFKPPEVFRFGGQQSRLYDPGGSAPAVGGFDPVKMAIGQLGRGGF